MEHQRHLSQLLLAGEAKTSRAMRFSGGNAPRVTSAPTSMSKPNRHEGELPRGHHPKEKGGKGKDKKDTSKIPCLFYPKGTCKNCKNCPFMHKDASPFVPAKGDGDKGGKSRSPSSKRRRPSKKRGKGAEKTAACCLSPAATLMGVSSLQSRVRFALAARKGDANKRDHWVVDERKGTCTRIHQKFRTCLYVPQPGHCPVPFWRLKGNVEVRKVPVTLWRKRTTSRLVITMSPWIGGSEPRHST